MSGSTHTHYDNLKVARDAPPEVIRAAYRTLTQKYHPDKNPGDERAARIMKVINASYEVLSNPESRRLHDAWIAEQEKSKEPPFQHRGAQNKNTEDSNADPSKTEYRSSPATSKAKANDWTSGIIAIFRGMAPLIALASFAFVMSWFGDQSPPPRGPKPYEATPPQSSPQPQDGVSASALPTDGTPIQQQELALDSANVTCVTLFAYGAGVAHSKRSVYKCRFGNSQSFRFTNELPKGAKIVAATTHSPAESAIPARNGIVTPTPNWNDLSVTPPAAHPSGGANRSLVAPKTAAAHPYVRSPFAPNGEPWPKAAGYVSKYRKLNTNGHSTVTVDNALNDSDVFVKLVSLSGAKAYPARQFFIPAHGAFTAKSVSIGAYDVRYRDLDTGSLSRTQSFDITEIAKGDGIEYSEMNLTLYKVRGGNMQTYELAEDEF